MSVRVGFISIIIIEECLINFYEEPEAMHELIDYLTEYELKHAEQICKHYKIDALFHHDDWGTQKSTFMDQKSNDGGEGYDKI